MLSLMKMWEKNVIGLLITVILNAIYIFNIYNVFVTY